MLVNTKKTFNILFLEIITNKYMIIKEQIINIYYFHKLISIMENNGNNLT